MVDFARVEAEGTIRILAKERRDLRRQRAQRDRTILRLRGKIATLEETITDLEAHIGEIEDEGIDLCKEVDAFLSDNEDYHEEMDIEEEEDDEEELIDDGEEEPEVLLPEEEEEDPVAVIFEA